MDRSFVSFLFILCISIIGAQQTCITPNGEVARCVDMVYCPHLWQALEANSLTTFEFVVASICSRTPPLMLCCGSDTTYKRLDRSLLLPDRDSCGFQEDTYKVFGGSNTGITEYPWTAALMYNNSLGQVEFKCAGSLISNKYVLTAAHCLTFPNLKLVRVRLGDWNLDTPEDCLGPARFKQCISKPIDVEVEDIIIHEEYARTRTGISNDIALIRLESPVSYSSSIKPICLPKWYEESSVGETVSVAGWGQTEYSKYSPIKQKVDLPIVDSDECQNVYGRSGFMLNNGNICAGGKYLKDSCNGDSGGPLMARIGGDPNQLYLEGIVSVGPVRCGTRGMPAIYTKVNQYLDWIISYIKP